MKHSAVLILVAALVTALTRFLPFLVFGQKRQPPKWVMQLGKRLPGALMGMLVVYCMKDVRPLRWPYGLPELLGCSAVVALHVWKRNSLVSIGGGTAVYMLLVQFVF